MYALHNVSSRKTGQIWRGISKGFELHVYNRQHASVRFTVYGPLEALRSKQAAR